MTEQHAAINAIEAALKMFLSAARDNDAPTGCEEIASNALARLSALRDQLQGGWLPISEAPRDGTKIDIYVDILEERYPDSHFDSDRGYFVWNIPGTSQRLVLDATPPNHFQYITSPPTNPITDGEE